MRTAPAPKAALCAAGLLVTVLLVSAVGAAPAARAEDPDPVDPATRYIVELAAPPTAVTGEGETEEYAQRSAELQREIAADAGAEPEQSFTRVLNGFTAELTAEQASSLEARAEVLSVTPEEYDVPLTATEALGLPGQGGLWEQIGGEESAGEGVVVGVIDTGISPENPMFAGDPIAPLAGDPTVPHASADGGIAMLKADGGMFTGECATGPDFAATDCSTKLVSARFFGGPEGSASPRGTDGHGSHVASIAVGNRVQVTVAGATRELVGAAPAARLAVYRACWSTPESGGSRCSTVDQVAAIEAAVVDGVDVINYSLGKSQGGDDSVNSPVDRALLAAAADGITVVAAAANGGPQPSSVDHVEPWVLTVAANSVPQQSAPPVVHSQSGRGPALAVGSDLLKPDISAPGTNILAATRSGPNGEPRYATLGGTSMAAPFVSALAAVYLGANPEASPSEVKSALLTTASPLHLSNGSPDRNRFAGGAGTVSPNTMRVAPLVYESGADEWYGMLNGLGADTGTDAEPIRPSDLNLPSLAAAQVAEPLQTTRTVTSTAAGDFAATAELPGFDVSVEPSTLSFSAPGQTLSYTVTLTPDGAESDVWQHGRILWSGGTGSSLLPIVARAVEPDPEPPIDLPDPPVEEPRSPFADVLTSDRFFTEIAWMHESGISAGTRQPSGKPKYEPKAAVSREAMAAFLYRLEGSPVVQLPASSPFADVKPGDKFYREIVWMHRTKLSTGTRQPSGKPRYEPKAAVSREAMAAFLYRLEQARYRGPASSPFADVKRGQKFYDEIAWMHESGISTGTRQPSGKPKYGPKAAVSREAMAAFLFRVDAGRSSGD